MTDNKEIKKKDDRGLLELITEKRKAVRTFRFSNAGSATRDVRQVRADKKDVARALTELNTRAREAATDKPKTK